jgi:formate hydrogenlyase subunit 6/NADH:ubiquinone oxidoreductase subunit I
MPQKKGYFKSNWDGIVSLLSGMQITFRHLKNAITQKKSTEFSIGSFEQPEGIVTIQYPQEETPVPQLGRYKLHNEIDDCIVCDLCAKICPVDCIEIDSVRSVEDLGQTSDGTAKRIHPLKFDIDMDKCMFCGLCTTVCPTECLTMKPEYDYSVYDKEEFTFKFSDYGAEKINEKMEMWSAAQAKKK